MKRRSQKTTRGISAVISVVLSVALVMSSALPVFAETGDAAASGKVKFETAQPGKTLLRPGMAGNAGETATNGDESLEGSVVVLMEDGSIGTEKKVKSVLSTGEEAVKDIEVEEVWNFDAKDSGLHLDEEGGENASAQEDAVVALVSSDSMSADKLVKKLNERKDVKLAEKNVKVHALSVTNDQYVDHQWSMQDDEIAPHVPYEWNEKGVKGSEKIVAVVDTGVNYTHPDLKDNMWVNTHRKIKGKYGFDFINGDPDPMDDNGHGTHCAGIIGAAGNNGIGTSGVNQNIKIMALKILDYEGSAYLSHEIAAYNYINMALDLGEPVVAINNSWGGGEDSGILVKLIDIVGEKGAVTVCAAGNEGANNDEEPAYPADLDSPYIISVGATGRDGKLAYFSNYGESVDIAAPGVEILSTVSYDSYNPTIYGDDQSRISAGYNGFENDETWGIPETYYLNGEELTGEDGTFTGENGQTIKAEKIDAGFGGTGNSLQLTFKDMEEEDLACFTIPYVVGEEDKIKPYLSFMETCKSDSTASMFGGPVLGVVSVPEDTKLDLDTLGNMQLGALTYVVGDFDLWDHMVCADDSDAKPGDRRKFVVLMYAYDAGDYMVRLDDLGISRQDIEEEDFGKYDFMSGTSMATPFITGTVALKMAEKEQAGSESENIDVINEICAMAKEEPEIETGSKGTFDFRLVPTFLPPRIGKVTVWPVTGPTGAIRIEGSGLNPYKADMKVEFGTEDDSMREATIIDGDDRSITVKNEGWINNIETVRVTNESGKKSEKKNIYLVKGKQEYTKEKNKEFTMPDEAYTTDGKKVYGVSSGSGEIAAFTPSKTGGEDDVVSDVIGEVDPAKLFNIEKQEHAKYGMLFGKDLVYSNKMLYTVVEYGAIDAIEQEEEDFFFFGKGNGKMSSEIKSDDDFDDDDEIDGPYAIYAGEYRLIKVNPALDSESSVTSLGELPDDLADLEGFTVGAYNGKLYFIGGFRGYGEDKVYSDKVFIYDPSTGKWTDGAPIPEPRACGKALQYGNVMYYTLGENAETADAVESNDGVYTMRNMPDNLVFDGTEWKACQTKNSLTVFGPEDNINVGITADGLIYTGAAFADLGDTFIYNVASNEYVDTGFNYMDDLDDDALRAVAVGNKLYGEEDGDVYSLPITSGLKTVKVSKKGKGKVTGAGSYVPGNNVKLTVKASKKYYIKSFKVGSTKIKLKKNATKKTYTIKKLTANKKVTVVFAKKKSSKKKSKKK